MDNEQGNVTDAQSPTGSPFTRPGFLVSAALIAVIVVLAVVVSIRVADNTTSETAPPASTIPVAPSPTSRSANPDASVCGLSAGTETEPLISAPAVTWDYQGTIAYPKSPEFGAGRTAAHGYRYCFQHSPAGAVVMAANALAQGSDPQLGRSWAEYVLGEGSYRDRLADEIGAAAGAEGSRLKIAGFRVLSYDGGTARVDLGVQGSSQNQTLSVSGVYELVWQDGDWKISADVEHPLDISTIPDLAGYVPWGE